MKKVILAALLLTTGVAGAPELFAHCSTQVSYALPKPVQNAFAAYQAGYTANNMALTNVVWTHSGNTYTATFVVVNMNLEDSYANGSVSFQANGNLVN